MNRPEPTVTAIEEDTTSVASAESWGEKEVAREIALLEAHVRQDTITKAVDALAALDFVARDHKQSTVVVPQCILDELNQSYLDYAMSVIVGRELPVAKAARTLRRLSQRAGMILAARTNLASLLKFELKAALALHRFDVASRALSAQVLTLKKSAESACFSNPLFAYGPELSEFRHRFR
ncbi:hypothetical protein N5C69_19060 [Pseudomonas aeruginosa]|nr:hypothetical protein [Pseudomonas aeruginosa]MDH0765050.1 hypothetical protein [Pseudomonas aeruginosa]MDH1040677.1 hypothetical protein [Pseudomonas aeruginosa]MDH1287626.1 hypothetical protein [Pseudomonas aeruginosa]HCI2708062.1 hypothetical protein [Pseudomonas aeruginosa]